ncbi:Uncharacterised protein [uncultured archaeon]|nr:Uncharacterised protein [uncultured archaeon]
MICKKSTIKQMKYLNFCKNIFVYLLIFSTIVLPVFAQFPDGTQPPTQDEQGIFHDKLNRLMGNSSSMPIDVSDVINSFSGNVTKSFNCPPGSRVNSVTIITTTTLVGWNSSLAEPNSAGTYYWNLERWTIAGGRKNVIFHNWVMLDPNVTSRDEADPPLGTLADEGLLYHELLHGQLLINAMNSADWQRKACNCTESLQPADKNHTTITPAVNAYFDNRTRGIANVTIVQPQPGQADANGNFSIDLGHTNKIPPFNVSAREPEGGSNVDIENITVDVDEQTGHIIVRGKLINTSRAGKFYIRIDPPSEWIIGGIEEPIVVLPSIPPVTTTPVRSTSTVGITALIGIFLVASMLHKIKRRQ